MISCGNYDYIEVACLYRYAIKLTLKSNKVVEGVAIDTQRDERKNECIKLKMADEEMKLIVLDEIIKMEASVTNPHFGEVVF